MPTKKIVNNLSVIKLKLTILETDPVEYKPYKPTFVPEKDVYVEVPVEYGEATFSLEDVVLTLTGFKSLLKNLSNAIDETEKERQADRQTIYNKRK